MSKNTGSFVFVPFLLAAMACWLLFVASFTVHELILGAAFAGLTVGVSALAWRHMSVRFAPTPRQLITVWRLPWYVVRDSVEVTLILMRDLAGTRHARSLYRTARFAGASRKREDARVVLTTAATTMTPSIIVLGVHEDRMFLHQLECEPIPQMIKDFEAQP